MSRLKFIVARYENDNFEGFLSESIGKFDHVFIDNTQANSIFEKYNLGIEHFTKLGVDAGDIFVFIHADVKILDENFSEKIEYAFDTIPKLGVAGVIGSAELNENAGWWLSDQSNHRGHLVQWVDNKEENKYHMIRQEGNFTDVVAVDGLCLAVIAHVAQNLKFDAQTYPESYDMYDYDFCLTTLSNGYKIAVLDILTEHRSAGTGIYKDSWKINKEKFLAKWKAAGVIFPLKIKNV
jgi:hypothetical protein